MAGTTRHTRGYKPTALPIEEIVARLIKHGVDPEFRRSIEYTFKLEREKTKELEALSLTDPLTGLENFRALEKELEIAKTDSDRHGNNFSLVYLDLDGFKAVNDTYGHDAGDKILTDIAELLIESLRPTDRKFRQGGDEFAIILPQTSLIQGTIVAEKIRYQIGENISYRGLPINGTLGVGNYIETSQDIQSLKEYTDAALYHSKKLGKNRVSSHNGAEIIPFAA